MAEIDPRLLTKFVFDTVLEYEVDKLVDDPASTEEKVYGVCTGCGARYSGITDERQRWRENHKCSKVLLQKGI